MSSADRTWVNGSMTTSVANQFSVTTMLILQANGHMTWPFAEYLAHFRHIEATGIPIMLYLDPAFTHESFASNVTVIPTAIQDLSLWQEIHGFPVKLPSRRNQTKDTADYLVITNSKTELALRTIEHRPHATHHLFLDFGLFHVVRDTAHCQSQLLRLLENPPDHLIIPGIYANPADELDAINWRFCGGLFVGPTADVIAFSRLHQQTVREHLPVLSWEVNIWAWMETNREFRPHWFQAEHNDSMFDFPSTH